MIEIEKWRDQQLADLDRFLDRIEETFEAGEAPESYRKAAELLESKGVDEALAYLQARSGQRQELIELQTTRRDREEDELRKLLQEELLTASLLENNFQFDEAEAKYRAVVEKAGNGPRGWNDFAWFLIQRAEVIDPGKGNEKLREAANLCRGTLALTSRTISPHDWARTQNNLALALWNLADVGLDAAMRRERLEKAAEICETLIVASDQGVIERSTAADFLRNLSFCKLKLDDAAGALAAAKKGLEADPSQIWINANLLSAHLLLDEWEKAEDVLTEDAAAILFGDKPFWHVMLDDFDEFQKFGVNHPTLERMRRHIETDYKRETERAEPAGEQD